MKTWQSSELYKTWQQINRKIADIQKVIRDLEELTQNINDPNWWVKQYVNALNQCYGAAVLSLLAVGVYGKRRKK